MLNSEGFARAGRYRQRFVRRFVLYFDGRANGLPLDAAQRRRHAALHVWRHAAKAEPASRAPLRRSTGPPMN